MAPITPDLTPGGGETWSRGMMAGIVTHEAGMRAPNAERLLAVLAID
jgi:hypothetical protein